jgi:hypothetical protein
MLTLRNNGFDVWVVSASAKEIVSGISDKVGVPPDHVLGLFSWLYLCLFVFMFVCMFVVFVCFLVVCLFLSL